MAADLLSQAEHDELASAILITTSQELAEKVSEEVDGFLKVLSRSDIISKSLDNFGYILVTDSHQEAIDTVDAIAPEHLEIVTKNPFEDMMKVHNAGAIFLGENSSEPLGDYFAGPNHILPTNGTAKFFSPLSVDDFVKKSSIIYYSREALSEIHEDIESFAKSESLTAHAIRLPSVLRGRVSGEQNSQRRTRDKRNKDPHDIKSGWIRERATSTPASAFLTICSTALPATVFSTFPFL